MRLAMDHTGMPSWGILLATYFKATAFFGSLELQVLNPDHSRSSKMNPFYSLVQSVPFCVSCRDLSPPAVLGRCFAFRVAGKGARVRLVNSIVTILLVESGRPSVLRRLFETVRFSKGLCQLYSHLEGESHAGSCP